jgi:nucleotide-binding universal stress UspA family protein
MMATAWVSGSGHRAERLADRLRAAGHEVTVYDLGSGALPPVDSVDYYLQLPIAVFLSGDTLVGRVRSFLSSGLLTRFALVEQLLPSLRHGARVALISGNIAAGAALPDDQHARLALLHVLAHAAQAELASREVQVQVVGGDRSDDEIVRYLLHGGEDTSVRLLDDFKPLSKRQYDDWRTEVMGLRSAVTA